MLQELFPPTLDDLIGCAEREIRLRRRVYPRRIAEHKMTEAKADREIKMMEAIRDELADLRKSRGRAPEKLPITH